MASSHFQHTDSLCEEVSDYIGNNQVTYYSQPVEQQLKIYLEQLNKINEEIFVEQSRLSDEKLHNISEELLTYEEKLKIIIAEVNFELQQQNRYREAETENHKLNAKDNKKEDFTAEEHCQNGWTRTTERDERGREIITMKHKTEDDHYSSEKTYIRERDENGKETVAMERTDKERRFTFSWGEGFRFKRGIKKISYTGPNLEDNKFMLEESESVALKKNNN